MKIIFKKYQKLEEIFAARLESYSDVNFVLRKVCCFSICILFFKVSMEKYWKK